MDRWAVQLRSQVCTNKGGEQARIAFSIAGGLYDRAEGRLRRQQVRITTMAKLGLD
jgi:hypothetical protein